MRHLAFALLIGCGSSSPNGTTIDGSTPGTDGTITNPIDGSTTTVDGAIPTDKFSFFVVSYKAIQQLSGSANGFGGDLRFGETGQGAGLRGADKICRTVAEQSLAGAGNKTWHAFLSVAKNDAGVQEDAIDRIGSGPWYDRLGRELAPSLSAMMATRPTGGDATIKNDFPNEDGVPNHNPDGTGAVDNHDMLTGSNTSGRLMSTTSNCLDWTANAGNKTTEGKPQVGHSWPRNTGGGGGGMDDWRSSLTESGCAPGVNLIETGGPNPNSNTVGSGGGYGGFYCFALEP